LKLAYVNSSCLVAIVLGEIGSEGVAGHLAEIDRLISSNLLEAELKAVLARDRIQGGEELLVSSNDLLCAGTATSRYWSHVNEDRLS
jgi:uncharacterized protein with PIN domain